jgi:hypothetical protein
VIVTCASSAFHLLFERGDLTQLEFLDACAGALGCDGAVLDVRHFPRTDGEYLAQVKKMAADRGLWLVALADDRFFRAGEERAIRILEDAVALGAPLIAAPLAHETECTWSDQLSRISAATAHAKRYNVTLALRNAPGTFAASVHDCKRVVKEADSAWLRLGPQPAALDAASDPEALAPNAVLLWRIVGEQPRCAGGRSFAGFRGVLAIDEPSGGASMDAMREAARAWRAASLEALDHA